MVPPEVSLKEKCLAYEEEKNSGIDIANLDSETLCNLLLYGSPNMNMIDNRIIIEATIEYIEKANRLN